MANSPQKIKFTLPSINKLACLPGKTQTLYWCTETPGLGVRVMPSQYKAFIFEASFQNRTIRLTIGDVRSWTLPKVQAQACHWRVMIDQGIDPRQEKPGLLCEQKRLLRNPSLRLLFGKRISLIGSGIGASAIGKTMSMQFA